MTGPPRAIALHAVDRDLLEAVADPRGDVRRDALGLSRRDAGRLAIETRQHAAIVVEVELQRAAEDVRIREPRVEQLAALADPREQAELVPV